MENDALPNLQVPPHDTLPPPAPVKPSRWQRFLAFPLTRIVLNTLVIVCIFVVFALALGAASRIFSFVTRALHWHVPIQALMQKNPALLGTFFEGLLGVSTVLAFWIMVRFLDRRPWATAGFNRQGMASGLLGGFALGALMLTAGVGVLHALGAYHVSKIAPSVLVLAPLFLYLCVGVFEETFFRGYAFQTLEGRWGSGVALVTTSVVFGLVHLSNPVPGASHWMRFAGPLQICFEAGLPLGAAYLLTRRWWLPIAIHWAWDYFEGPIYGCPDSGNHDPHTLLHATLTGPALLTGGPFGPEAGLVFLAVGTLAGVLLLWAAVKKGHWVPRPRRAF